MRIAKSSCRRGLHDPSSLCVCVLLQLFMFANLISSQPLLRLRQIRRFNVPSAASSAPLAAAAMGWRTPEQQEQMHLPESLAFKRSKNALKGLPQQPSHHHMHSQTLSKSVSLEEAVDLKGSAAVKKQAHANAHNPPVHPETFFEVSTPLDPPPRSRCASLHIFSNSFANTSGMPPAMANYTPPSLHTCKDPSHWSLVVLTWSGNSIGRQFDRIAAVWFGGVELLRTCTAEPTKRGIVWEVKKDITKYAALLAEPQPIVVELGNVVDDRLTGIFHINLTLDFYSASHQAMRWQARHRPHAALILPVSSPSPLPSGHWFQIPSDTYVAHKSFSAPTNVYKAVLEVYVSFHGGNEFWYTNPPNDYLKSNNLTGDIPGKGTFREVQALLDGQLVGAIWPFPVVYTGGIVNLYWRPAAAIRAFNLPTYEFDISPFVGVIADGKEHTLGFRVENAAGNWLIDGCLHLWLDQKVKQTGGKLVSYRAPAYMATLASEWKGLDGTFRTTVSRTLSYSGYIVSSMGNQSVSSSYALAFDNVLVLANSSESQTTTQAIHTKAEIRREVPSKLVLYQESLHSFPLDLSCLTYEGANNSVVFNCNLNHSFVEKVTTVSDSGSFIALLSNRQQGQGQIAVVDSTVVAGLAALQQQYSSEGNEGCYTRVLSTKNSSILYDSANSSCSAVIS